MQQVIPRVNEEKRDEEKRDEEKRKPRT